MKPSQLTLSEKLARLEIKVAIAGAVFRNQVTEAKKKIAEQNSIATECVRGMQNLVRQYLTSIENQRLHLQFKRTQRAMTMSSRGMRRRAVG